MGLHEAKDIESRFARYVEGLVSVIGHADRAGPLHDYCLGLVMPGERKSVEPMAAITAPGRTAAQHQSLLHFVATTAADSAASSVALTPPSVSSGGRPPGSTLGAWASRRSVSTSSACAFRGRRRAARRISSRFAGSGIVIVG